MGYVFKKTYSEEYNITLVLMNFMKFSSFNKVRKDITKCEVCLVDFNQDDFTHLAFVERKKNHLICDKCADKALKGGAKKN